MSRRVSIPKYRINNFPPVVGAKKEEKINLSIFFAVEKKEGWVGSVVRK